VHLAWGDDGPGVVLLVAGPGVPDLGDRLAVVPASALPDAVVPMAGRWNTAGVALSFAPGFPFSAGTTYALVRRDADPTSGAPGWVEVARLQRPVEHTPPTTSVVAIHPTAAVVPENLLRVSVTFSAPMEEGSAAGHVHLEDGDGRVIAHGLLAMPPELWDRPRRRLTLLLEPGRIKRGLVPNTELGAPLSHSPTVTVVVDDAMRDATGTALVAGARRSYRVEPALRTRVDPAQWDVSWPTAGVRDPLVVDLDRPLDHALALRCLRVTSPDGRGVVGHAALGPGEVRWSFTPAAPWPDGPYELHVDAALEDLAGNSVRRVLDRDLRLPQDDPRVVDEVVLRSEPPPQPPRNSPNPASCGVG
jgi:hypothetical protein